MARAEDHPTGPLGPGRRRRSGPRTGFSGDHNGVCPPMGGLT